MFNTVKSKILAIVFSMLIVLSIVLGAFAYFYLKNSKFLIIHGASFSIGQFVQNINKDIIKFEDNARDLALMGEVHYNSTRERSVFEYIVKKVFKNYPESLGGGIWFKPETLSKLYCVYAFRNKNQDILIDKRYETDEYNYPNQKWYKEITSKVTKENNIAWSSPYYEKEGGNTSMVTVGSGIYDNDKLIGISTVDWELNSIINSMKNMRPTPNSFVLFADEKNDFVIALTDPYLQNAELYGKSLKNVPWYNTNLRKITYITYHDEKYVPYVKNLDNGMSLIVCVPKYELFYFIILQVKILFTVLIIISVIISLLLYLGLNNNITRPIKILVDTAKKISKGNLDMTIRITRPEEFANLAETFDKMAKEIAIITKQREKIDAELNLAKSIQASSLPNIFPPYPERYDLDIYASMNPALNVGGDFYDFFFINEDKFMFLVADVSGKGVPAALFMMIVKTIVNGVFHAVDDIPYAIKYINNQIRINNKYNFFVTLLGGIVDLKANKISLINCGHNPPLIKRGNGDFEFVELDSNIVLGAIPDFDFSIKELDFNPNDEIYMYTDGVTEAMNKNGELYSEKRLKEILNLNKNLTIEDKCKKIKQNIDEYSSGVEQSDDITMINFKYFGKEKKYRNIATKDNYKFFGLWLRDNMEKLEVPEEKRQNIELIFEEIYTNIFSYAYQNSQGEAELEIGKKENDIIITFTDWGTPYNPLEKPDPDIDLPPSERPIGGLGIYMVKQLAKSVEYKYENANILTVAV